MSSDLQREHDAARGLIESPTDLADYIDRNPDRGCVWRGQAIPRCVACPLPRCGRDVDRAAPSYRLAPGPGRRRSEE